MFPETARILRIALKGNAARQRHIVNLGSGTLDYCLYQQPYIWEELMEPLSEEDLIVNVDEKPDTKAARNIIHVRSDLRAVPLDDHAADILLCLSVLEHVESPCGVIAESLRLMNPYGRAFFEVPHEYPSHPDPIDTGLRIGTPAEWADLLGPSWKIEKFWHIVSASRPGSCTMVEVVRA